MKNYYSILIIEDELLIAEMLKEMLIDLNYHVVGLAKNYGEAMVFLESDQQIDLCFLDINLESTQNGLDVAKAINTHFFVPFIFLTSYSDKQMVSAAIALQPEAYLIKPFTSIDLFSTIEIVKAKSPQKQLVNDRSIVIKENGINFKLKHNDIKWIKSDNVYIELVTNDKTYVLRASLEGILSDLNDPVFARIHRSYAVNLSHVMAFQNQHIFVNETPLPLSRKHKEEVFKQFSAL